MPLPNPAPSNKRKKASKIITDLSHISQNEDEQDHEAAELDLGTKIKTPKDVMLEELSLMKNKGSKMFRMRQQRVERFIVTNENLQNFQNLLMSPPVVPPKPVKPKEEKVEETVNEEEEKAKRRKEYVRTYVSPWERAMTDEELKASMKPCMPGPIQTHPDLPQYKSFNRTALPYGGFEKASKMLTFELPEVNTASEEQEPLPTLQADIRSRPSFNRTPIGWVCSDDNSHIQADVEVPFDGETDDL
ncbi:PREDICTED: myozenin-1-like isoform X1 [Cyprinodon variegatus]|uniref:Myozenin 1b n=1 Tax=Cyprinodon variegatus TaxID=28743 RepID=A0A3Q2G5E3_CYPVA|nr:PREDICTED: myozenin-1-like isoform X1 [Cyprinodon variegatus]